LLLVNLFLALAWVALSGQSSPANFLAGFLLGYFMLWLVHRAAGPSRYFSKVPATVAFALFFLWELILASLRVSFEVVSPRRRMRPGVVAIPLEARTDAEIALLGNLITLTPGSLTLDVSDDRKVLYLHHMYVGDREAAAREVKYGFERRMLEVLR
jgi:multicomponent Na+:H+ antiporter subunit E